MANVGRGLTGGQLIDGRYIAANVMCCAYGDIGQEASLALLSLLRAKNETIASFDTFLVVHNSSIRDSSFEPIDLDTVWSKVAGSRG